MKNDKYAEWIRRVRGKTSQTAFGEMIVHYKQEGDRKICQHYHKNSIGNWESGKNLPLNIETFLSMALYAYDNLYLQGKLADLPPEVRKNRYDFAEAQLEEILGIELYCRNLYDALLITVCRGVITFEELPRLEPYFEKIISAISISPSEKKEIALEPQTMNIKLSLFGVETVDQLEKIILDNQPYFYTASRTFGERFVKIYHRRKRYAENLTLQEAVGVYAPNYRDSYLRLYSSSGITRQWILDLCIHLRFNREEMNEILKNAHMVPLSDDEGEAEYYYKAIDTFVPGSGDWYRLLEARQFPAFPPHYAAFSDMSLQERLTVLLILTKYTDENDWEGLPPVDYLLESFTINPQGSTLLKETDKLLKKMYPRSRREDPDPDYVLDALERRMQNWESYIQSGMDNSLESQSVGRIFMNYRNECRAYYYCPGTEGMKKSAREEADRLHFMASLFYTVLTGKYYEGELRQTDLDSIREIFPESAGYVYRFLSQVLGTFLGNQKIYTDDGKNFYRMNQNKKGKKFSFSGIMEDLLESIQVFS